MINKLINLANYLDKADFGKEADRVDFLIKTSWDDAGWSRELLRRQEREVERDLEPRSRRVPESDKRLVAEAIRVGDQAHVKILEGMRLRVAHELGPLLERSIAEELDQFIVDNPGVDSISQVTDYLKNEIKRNAIEKTVEEYKRQGPVDAAVDEYIKEISRRLHISAVPPTGKQILQRYLYDFTYQFVFGFVDNFVLVLAASVLDPMLEKRFGSKGMGVLIAAGIGNLISDVMGDIGGISVQEQMLSTKMASEMATDEQLELADPFAQLLMRSATTTGVASGCVVGLGLGLLIVKGVGTAALTWTLARAAPSAQLSLFEATSSTGFRTAMTQALRASVASVEAFEAVAAATLTGAVITVGAILTLVTAGILGIRWKMTQNVLDDMTRKSLENSHKTVRNSLWKIYNDENPGDRLGSFLVDEVNEETGEKTGRQIRQSEFTEDHFLNMLHTRKSLVQEVWDAEMNIEQFRGNPDINLNIVYEWIAAMSFSLGLENPNG